MDQKNCNECQIKNVDDAMKLLFGDDKTTATKEMLAWIYKQSGRPQKQEESELITLNLLSKTKKLELFNTFVGLAQKGHERLPLHFEIDEECRLFFTKWGQDLQSSFTGNCLPLYGGVIGYVKERIAEADNADTADVAESLLKRAKTGELSNKDAVSLFLQQTLSY